MIERRIGIVTTLVGLPLGLSRPATGAGDPRDRRTRPQILVHDMPWFGSKATSGAWGWHRTMGRSDDPSTQLRATPDGLYAILLMQKPLPSPLDRVTLIV